MYMKNEALPQGSITKLYKTLVCKVGNRCLPSSIYQNLSRTLLVLSLVIMPGYAHAQLVEDFYVPLPEAAALDFFTDISTDGVATAPLITRTDIVIREADTVIISDPSIDGFETEYVTGPFAATTEFWGDGDCTNGFKPTIAACTVGADDTLDIGEVIIFDANEVNASDYFRSNRIINLTRSAFPTGTGTFLAGAFELFPTAQWGTSYVVPIGENTADSGETFEQVAVTIMAREDGTVVTFDPDGPGAVTAIVTTIDQGESVEFGIGAGLNGQALVIEEGATISSTLPTQANVLTGDNGSTYETRFYTLFPNSLLSNEYYEAVGTTELDTPASVFLFNPNTADIVINQFDNLDPVSATPSTITVPAGGSAKIIMPAATANGLTGLRFASAGGEVFSAYTVVDDQLGGVDGAGNPVANSGQIHDWGHVTTPLRLMGDIIRVGFAPGSNPEIASTLNASPIWVIADLPGSGAGQDIEICVDSQGDGNDPGTPGGGTDPVTGVEYDYSVIVQPLDSTRLYNSGPENLTTATDGEDQTGMLAFACNTASSATIANPFDVIIAAAWGQDPDRAAPGDDGFDVGTTIRTGSNNRQFIGDTVFFDLNSNGVREAGEAGIPNADVEISTTDPTVDLDLTTPAIDSSFTVQTDSDGLYLFTSLQTGVDYTITVTPPAGFSFVSDPDGVIDGTTTLTLVTSTLEQDFGLTDNPPEISITKTSSANGAIVNPGDTILYTIVVTNEGTIPLENIVVNDVLPAGVTYTTAPFAARKTVIDDIVTTGTFNSADLVTGTLAVDNVTPSTISITLPDDGSTGIPSGATITSYQPFITGANINNFPSDIDIVGTYPGGTAVDLDPPAGFPGGNQDTAFSVNGAAAINAVVAPVTSPAVTGSAFGAYSFIFNDSFDDNTGDDEYNVTEARFDVGWESMTVGPVTNAAGAPPSLVVAADDVDLEPGQSVTIEFNVVVDDPLPSNIDELINTAQATSVQTPTPVEASVTDLTREGQAFPQCGTQMITFDEVDSGGNRLIPLATGTSTTVVNNQYATATGNDNFPLPNGAGVTFTATGGIVPAGDIGIATVYNADFGGIGAIAPNGQDTDLEVGGGLGNVLIIEENGTAANPGAPDDATDGTLIIDYELPVAEFGITFVDFEEGDAQFEFFDLDEFGNPVPGTPGNPNPVIITNSELANGSGSLFAQTDPGCVLAATIPGAVCNISNGITTADGSGEGLIGIAEIDRVVVNLGIAGASGGIDNIRVELACGTLTLQGNVFDDDDALTDNTVDGTGTNAGGLFASLVGPDGNVVASVPVAANGAYEFGNVDPNTAYTVQLNTTIQAVGSAPSAPDLPTNFVNTGENIGAPGSDGSPNGILAVNTITEDIDNANFGIQENSASITGNVLQDVDGNASGDIGIAGATVQLYNANASGVPSTLVATTTTDVNGNYQFDGLTPGNYAVVSIDPAGFQSVNDGDSSPDAGTDAANLSILDNLIPVNLEPGEVDADNDFVDAVLGSIEGTVWLDEDLDGILDIEETGITSVTVNLLDSSGVIIASVDTDANGNYSFEGIPAGNYTVDVVNGDIPVGLTNTAGEGGVDPKNVTVAPGEQVNDIDFGYIPGNTPGVPNLGAIGDRVWADANGDGIQDPGEGGIAGVELELRDADGNLVGGTVTTNANGDYLFTNVPLGSDYIVSIPTGQPELAGLVPTVGPQSEGGFVGNPVTLTPTLRVVTDIDFGFGEDTPGSVFNTVTDTVFFDQNGDGLQNNGDPGIEGVSVDILDSSGNIVGSAITDVNGVVTFTGLADDDYTLVVTDNANQLNDLSGTTAESLVGENGESDPITVAAGSTGDGNDSFGYNNPGLISGTIYVDGRDPTNPNFDQDPDEAGLSGVTVELRDSDGNVVASVVTGPDGSYEFDGLVPDTYTITVVPVSGSQTEDPDGGSTIGGGDNATSVTLGIGESSTGNDFGYTDVTDVFDFRQRRC